MEITCYSCGQEEECPSCGHVDWVEGITYSLEDFPLDKQEDAVIRHLCPKCGSYRTEM